MKFLYIAAAIPVTVLVVWAICQAVAAAADAVDRHCGRSE